MALGFEDALQCDMVVVREGLAGGLGQLGALVDGVMRQRVIED